MRLRSASILITSEPHNNLGGVYLSQGRLDEAFAKFQTVLKLNPNFPIDELLKEIATTLKLYPNYPEARRNLDILSEMARSRR
jgi:tetratricopeptide (TPR) repeat protein